MLSSTFQIEVRELRLPETCHLIQVKWFQKIKDIKDIVNKLTNIPPSKQLIFHSSCPTPLRNQITLHDLGIDGNGHSLHLAINESNPSSFILAQVKDIYPDLSASKLLSEIRNGLECNQSPTKTDILDCTGGVYFMRNSSGRKAAVFKPYDEEQGMPNNYKGFQGFGDVGLRPHFKPGQGYLREFAAYLLDEKNFCRVPTTTLVHLEHPCLNYPLAFGGSMQGLPYPKMGSMQEFVRESCSFEDIGSSLLSDFEVQKIALLDLRLLNCDRNASNILVIQRSKRRSSSICDGDDDNSNISNINYDNSTEDMIFSCSNDDQKHDGVYYELHPIDHGYCLPSKLLINEWDLSWFWYEQVQRPIHPDILDYIKELNIEESLKKLTSLVAVSSDCLFLLRLAHHMVLEGALAGLTFHDIASLIVRLDEDKPSILELLIAEAEKNAYLTVDMRQNSLNLKKVQPFKMRIPTHYRKNEHVNAKRLMSSIVEDSSLSSSPHPYGDKRVCMEGSGNCNFHQSQRNSTPHTNTQSVLAPLTKESLESLNSFQGSGPARLTIYEGEEIRRMTSLPITPSLSRNEFISMSYQQRNGGTSIDLTDVPGIPEIPESVESSDFRQLTVSNTTDEASTAYDESPTSSPISCDSIDSLHSPTKMTSDKSRIGITQKLRYMESLSNLQFFVDRDADQAPLSSISSKSNYTTDESGDDYFATSPPSVSFLENVDGNDDDIYSASSNTIPLARSTSFSGFGSLPLYGSSSNLSKFEGLKDANELTLGFHDLSINASSPCNENPKFGRVSRMSNDRRYAIIRSAEYDQLRLQFGLNAIQKLISRTAKSKGLY